MKKIFLIPIFLFAVITAVQSLTHINTTSALRGIGYVLGSAVYIGNFDGVDVYRAEGYGQSKYTTIKNRCKLGVGCCK